jgi:MFS family permease
VATARDYTKRTKWAYVATRVLDTPFWALYNLLPVILYKDLHISPMQIAIMIALKPLVSLLSMYWSSAINKRQDLIIYNIILARVLGYIPFFFFPFVNNPWFFIFAFGFYMMLAIGIVPAWMEILKLNIPNRSRERVFSYTQACGYMGGGLLPFVLGWILDDYFQAWRWLFPSVAFLGLVAIFFQRGILIPPLNHSTSEIRPKKNSFNLREYLLKPWKSAWWLINSRDDFRYFQIGSMILGCGLMIIQPALPVFFVEILNLSYTELSVAITLCKGLGFVAASPFWSHWIHRVDLYRLSAWIAILGCLFPICLLLIKWNLALLYIGYLIYGCMQAGNELVWNMSGPIFAKNEDSSVYSSVNIVTIGLRGCFIPLLGSFFCSNFGSSFILFLSGFLFLSAATCLISYSRKLDPGLTSL